MTIDKCVESRRSFLADVGVLASTVALGGCARSSVETPSARVQPAPSAERGDWDLRWLDTLRSATDRAVFDWPSLGDPADPIVLELAERYLDNCRSIYGTGRYDARVVLNIRTQAIVAAMSDKLWEQYSLGAEYNAKDPTTQQPAIRNPFWHRAPSPAPGIPLPTIADLVDREMDVRIGIAFELLQMADDHLFRPLVRDVGQPHPPEAAGGKVVGMPASIEPG